jgi:uncharacterized protein YbaR (Trm112 family)
VTQDDSLLALLACPKCHGTLSKQTTPSVPTALACPRCRLLYAVDDGLPNMLVEDAKPWTEVLAGSAQA